MRKSTIIFTNIIFNKMGLLQKLLNVNTVIELHQLFCDFIDYKGNIGTMDRKQFEEMMLQLALSNDNLKKTADGYYYIEKVRSINHWVQRITCYIDATDFVNNMGSDRTRSGLMAFLKCGGIVRYNGKDYCYYDINSLRKELK